MNARYRRPVAPSSPGRFWSAATPQRGFTIAEILVTMAVIAILMGLLLPALSSVRTAGRMTTEMSAARQLMMAYTSYANVNRDAVMPGYKTGLPAYTEDGVPIADIQIDVVGARYPWRIAPFLGHNFRGLYLNEHRRMLDELEHQDRSLYVYTVSVAPSLGLNATWLGGHQGNLAFNPTAQSVYGRFYVTRLSEARRPDMLLSFCSARGTDPLNYTDNVAVTEGYFEVRSPIWRAADGVLWPETFDAGRDPADFGFVSPRYNGEAVTAFVDGHVDGLSLRELRDMRHWANQADSEEYGLAPR